MSHRNLREWLNAEWARIDHEAEANKDSQSAIFELAALYRDLSNEERFAANEVLIEWALSDDEKKQFDGLALIDEFLVSAAVPALRRLASRLSQTSEPSSPFDLAYVNRIIARLNSR